jgi:hypothetical protein
VRVGIWVGPARVSGSTRGCGPLFVYFLVGGFLLGWPYMIGGELLGSNILGRVLEVPWLLFMAVLAVAAVGQRRR